MTTESDNGARSRHTHGPFSDDAIANIALEIGFPVDGVQKRKTKQYVTADSIEYRRRLMRSVLEYWGEAWVRSHADTIRTQLEYGENL